MLRKDKTNLHIRPEGGRFKAVPPLGLDKPRPPSQSVARFSPRPSFALSCLVLSGLAFICVVLVCPVLQKSFLECLERLSGITKIILFWL